MNVEEAADIILMPYNTEKSFSQLETFGKLCFIVRKDANKPEITEAISILYKVKIKSVNTARTVYGKKAYVQFESPEKARDLATEIGML